MPEVLGAPPTFAEDGALRGGMGYLTIPERRVSHREAPERKYLEHQFFKKQNQVSQLRAFYG